MGNKIRKIKKEEIGDHYDIGDKLGTGSFAVVKKAIRKKDGKAFAIKIIKKSKLNEDELAVVHDEVDIMFKIDHPNCVKLYEIFETSKKLYMVMELLTGGELFERIVQRGSLSEGEAAALVGDIVSAISYLHDIGIVHRDLKPENLLFLDSSDHAPVKITDFGLAKYKSNQDPMTTACGTPGYVAPEVLQGKSYGKAVDMWSVGVICYILLCGFPPFYHENTAQLYKQIKRGQYDYPSPYWDEVSNDAKHFIKSLLNVDEKKRLTAQQALQHPWLLHGRARTDSSFGSAHTDRLKRLHARQKLRRGIQVIVAANKFTSVFRQNAQLTSASSVDTNSTSNTEHKS